MELLFPYGAAILSSVLVGWGLFLTVAAIVRQRRSIFGIVLKFLGLAPFVWAVAEGREQIFSLVAVFFISLSAFLVLLTLARHRLLR